MPKRPARPCRERGCNQTTTDRSGYCKQHVGDHKWKNRIQGTTSSRGYGWRWQQLRQAKLAREPLCRVCSQNGRTTLATEVDHIKPKSSGGTDQWSNLQPICRECHAQKTAREGNKSSRN